MAKSKLDKRLASAEIAIENALLVPEISTILAQYRYDTDRLIIGQKLLATAHDLSEMQRTKYGEQYEATDHLYVTWGKANRINLEHIKLARIALKGQRGAIQKLGLEGRRKKSLTGWVIQAKMFYQNALKSDQIMADLERFGLTEEKLEAGRTMVQDVVEANRRQEYRKGEAQQATAIRNRAMEALERWIANFKSVAKIALADQPELLKSLGYSNN